MSEMFDVYYPDGSYRGVFPRSECHGNPELIHCSVHIAVFDSQGRNILLQKRSLNKDIQPGKWDTAVGGHVDAGESIEAAARRELAEELGICNAELEFYFTSQIRNDIESENVTVFKLYSDGPFEFAVDEIDEIRFWPLEELAVENNCFNKDFTPNLQKELLEIVQREVKNV